MRNQATQKEKILWLRQRKENNGIFKGKYESMASLISVDDFLRPSPVNQTLQEPSASRLQKCAQFEVLVVLW